MLVIASATVSRTKLLIGSIPPARRRHLRLSDSDLSLLRSRHAQRLLVVSSPKRPYFAFEGVVFLLLLHWFWGSANKLIRSLEEFFPERSILRLGFHNSCHWEQGTAKRGRVHSLVASASHADKLQLPGASSCESLEQLLNFDSDIDRRGLFSF
jgi:hypothetical protein